MKYISVFTGVVGGLLFSVIPNGIAYAQNVPTSYWCGSYYSSIPCDYNGNYNYNYNYNYSYGYAYPDYTYTYPNNMYPYSSYYSAYQPHYMVGNYGYTLPRPTCTISAIHNTSYYGANAQLTLSWSSSNATSAYISPNVGNVSAYGSVVVYPYGGNYTYIMTVSGPGGSSTCQTTYYAPQQYYSQPQYQYSFPYTPYPYNYGYNW